MHYLQRREGVYYYRQRLPQQLGYGSIHKSLKTKDHPTAKHLLKLKKDIEIYISGIS